MYQNEIENLIKRTLADNVYLNRILSALFIIAGIIVAGNVLMLFFTYQGLTQTASLDVYLDGGVSKWYSAVLLALSALIGYNVSKASGRVSDHNTWMLVSFLLVIFSCSQIVNIKTYVGWSLFSNPYVLSQPLALIFTIAAPVLWLGWRMRKALSESFKASKCLLTGASLFVGGSIGKTLVAFYHGQNAVNMLWPMEMIVYEAVTMLGAILLFSGFILHEKYLNGQLRRVESARGIGGLPIMKSQTAEWAMKMIGTPSSDNPETDQDEVCQPRNRRSNDKKDTPEPLGDQKGG